MKTSITKEALILIAAVIGMCAIAAAGCGSITPAAETTQVGTDTGTDVATSAPDAGTVADSGIERDPKLVKDGGQDAGQAAPDAGKQPPCPAGQYLGDDPSGNGSVTCLCDVGGALPPCS